MIDFHAHILPGADHGSDGLETSLKQLALAEQFGIATIVATPHFYPQIDNLQSFLERRKASFCELSSVYRGSLRILNGCEVHLCSGLDHLDGLEQLCVEGTNILLLELSTNGWNRTISDTVLRISESGTFRPVLAHVDRYDPAEIRYFFDAGIPGQLNVESFRRFFGKKQYLKWIDEEVIVALGSDIHGTEIGYSEFARAKQYLGTRFTEVMERTRSLMSV